SEPYYKMREGEMCEAKAHIARYALQFLEEGQPVFLDAGTTMMSFARLMATYNLQVITTAPNIALELAASSNSSFILLGGQMNRHNISLSGAMAMDNLRNIEIDTAFIAASGYTEASGFTCGSHSEAELKKLAIARAKKKILLMDSGKFGKEMLFPFAALSDFDVFITDKKPEFSGGAGNTQIVF
ncbi:MAG: DeoR/GlpR transcriptional regulator, partial [Firmicutes bacterium]|nr:DeoR/GlpR transcriptional regulator [Bacillota bacterium]